MGDLNHVVPSGAVVAIPVADNGKRAGLNFKVYQELKSSVHRDLLNKVDVEKVATMRDERTRSQALAVIQDLVANLQTPLSGRERERLSLEVLDEVFGLGPLEPLLQDPGINDILVNGHKQVYVERAGMLEETNIRFKDDTHLMHIIDKILSGYISDKERIVTIEDSAELIMEQRHVVRLECRPANVEGTGAVKQRQLVINSLRMRPDRIVIGEVRGEEALDMLQAMNTGHDGSLTTIHANSPRDAISRMETMALMANLNLPEKAVRRQIASAVAIVIQVARMNDGTRRVTYLSEITGMEEETVSMQDVFVFEKEGISPDGRVLGTFTSTGIRPKFAEKLKASGINVPASYFDHSLKI